MIDLSPDKLDATQPLLNRGGAGGCLGKPIDRKASLADCVDSENPEVSTRLVAAASRNSPCADGARSLVS